MNTFISTIRCYVPWLPSSLKGVDEVNEHQKCLPAKTSATVIYLVDIIIIRHSSTRLS